VSVADRRADRDENHPVPDRLIASLLVLTVVSSCAPAPGPHAEIARDHGTGRGQAGERSPLDPQDAPAVGVEQSRLWRVPGRLAVGASGEAAGSSAGGLAAVGVMATALAAGVVYRWWKGVTSDLTRSAEPGSVGGRPVRPLEP